MEEVKVYLDSHHAGEYELKESLGRYKIVAKITGHEMPLNLDAIKSYFNSKKYKMHKECYSADFSKYEPYIVEHHSNKCVFMRKAGV